MNGNETKITVKENSSLWLSQSKVLVFTFMEGDGKESLLCSFQKKASEINCCLFIHHAEMIAKEFFSVRGRNKIHIAAYQKPEQ